MSANTPKVGEAAMLIRELRDMVHSLCLERGSTADCHGLMEDASRWLREDEATGTTQAPTPVADDRDYGEDYPGRVRRSKLPPGATDRAEAKATGTERDGPPDVNAGQAVWLDYHFPATAQDIQAAPSDWATVIDEAVLEPLERELADHHHALSKAVQAEHNRWAEKLRGWAKGREPFIRYGDGYRMALDDLAALLAEAEATDAADEQRMEPPTKTRGR